MCSLLNRKIYDRIKTLPPLTRKKINLQSVNGSPLTVDGSIEISIEIGGVKTKQLFYVVSNMNRNVILGIDFLKNNNVRLYYDLGCLRIKNAYVPFEEDAQISSLVRVASDQVLKPQTRIICQGKLRNSADLPPALYQVSSIDRGYLSHEPGLMLEDSVMKVNEKRTFPIMIVNETNKTFRLRRGCVIGKAEQVPSESVIEINHQPSEVSEVSESKPNFVTDAAIPLEHRSKLVPLLEKNADIFAQKDTELGETDTVQMTIDTGDHPPIKLRPYRAPINTRKKIEQAVDEMLEAKIIEKSDSPGPFPVYWLINLTAHIVFVWTFAS